jgi:hypothetical protein
MFVPLFNALSLSATLAASATHGALLYVVVPKLGVVDVYDATLVGQTPIGQISGLSSPGGLAVDPKGNVWIYDSGRVPRIAAYHRGEVTPFTTLAAVRGFGIAVDRTGAVYAATTTNVIEMYAPGSGSPTESVTDPAMTRIWNVAVDRAGDVFCNGEQRTASQTVWPVDEFAAWSPTPTRLMTLPAYGGLGVGSGDTLVVSAQRTVGVYAKPYTGKPLLKFTYRGYGSVSFALAITADGNDVWTMNDSRLQMMWPEKFSLHGGRKLDEMSPNGLGYSLGGGLGVSPTASF